MKKKDELWIVFDLETLSTTADAVVLSMGMLMFDLNRRQTFGDLLEQGEEIHFARKPQLALDRNINKNTWEWWTKQSEDARAVLHVPEEDCTHPREFFNDILYPYYQQWGVNPAWAQKNIKWASRGTHFDAAILSNMFADFNVSEPWKYWNLIDTRSWLHARGWEDNAKLVKPQEMVAHDAKHDVAFEALMLQTSANVSFDKIEFDR